MSLKLAQFIAKGKNKAKQQGSMLVMSLFVIVVLGLLGLTITRLLSASSETIIYEVLGQRALNAARAGIECKIAEKFPISGTSNIYCIEPNNKTFGDVPGLENCNYATALVDVTITDGLESFVLSKFSSTGQCSVGKVLVSRTLYIDARQAL
jgi:MSHA biogenesis protein MshP